MLGINKGLIWGQFRAPDKESVNTVERLREDFYSVDSISRALGRVNDEAGQQQQQLHVFEITWSHVFFSVVFLKLNFLFFLSFFLFKSLKLHAHQVKSQQQQLIK